MNKVNVGIGGINRNVDDGISTDGLSAELINMRVKNGSLEPVGTSILLQQFARKPVYVHKNAGYEHYICYNGNTLSYDYKREDGEFIAIGRTICQVPDLVRVEAIGNILIIVTGSDIQYAIYKNNVYSHIGSKPALPVLKFTKKYNIVKKKSIGSFPIRSSANPEGPSYNTVCSGEFYQFKSEAEDKGEFCETIFLRYGLRLVDGSLILHSPVYAIHDARNQIRLRADGANMSVMLFFGSYGISYSVDDPKQIGLWSDLISSIDIFICSRNQYNYEEFPWRTSSEQNIPIDENVYMVDNISSLFDTVDNFYFVQSLSVNDVSSRKSGDISIPKEILKNLEQQERMPIDDFSHHTVTAQTSYAYNGRLHIANTRTFLFEGFDMRYYQGINSNNLDDDNYTYTSSSVYTTMNTEQGREVVRSSVQSFTGRLLSPVIAFPDYRASELYFSNSSTGKRIQLKKHPFLNLAYYQDPALAGIEVSGDSVSIAPTAKVPIIESNKIKVSGLNSPLSFPVAQTYTVSNGDILGICAATSALSTGQFGQFPLYVFCTDGIYALEVGGANVVYSRAIPVSRDVCANPNSITSTDNAILFITESSLVMLQGSQAINLSSDIEGYLPTFLASSPIVGKIADIVGYDRLISSTEFLNYIKNARIGYNYNDKEIIVSNKDYSYSYVFNLISKGWHKVSDSVDSFLNSYPECFAYKTDGGVYDMYNPARTVNNILLITKPIKFGSLTHKRILQTAIRGIVRPSLSDVYFQGEPVRYRDRQVNIFSNCGFYVLGSNDAEHFVLIAGREKMDDIRDLITKMNKSKAYKYFVVCLSGGVRTDVSFNYFEFMVDETYTNRLR